MQQVARHQQGSALPAKRKRTCVSYAVDEYFEARHIGDDEDDNGGDDDEGYQSEESPSKKVRRRRRRRKHFHFESPAISIMIASTCQTP
jgi:hypothetical protein